MKYDNKPGAEFGWFGFGAALGVFAGAIVSSLGADSELAIATTGLVTAGTRLVLSFVLPSP